MKITMEMKRRRDEIGHVLESTPTELRNTLSVYSILNEYPLCLGCERTTSRGSMECQWCGSRDLRHRKCTNLTRAGDYLELLESVSLSPTKEAFRACSLSRLAKACGELNDRLKHSCEADQSCPLRKELQELGKRVHSIVYSKATLFKRNLDI